MSILTFHDVSQSFGAFDLFIGLSGGVPRDGKVGLVGSNGIGKTTLLYILAGVHKPTSGHVYTAKNARIGYLEQEAARAFADQSHTVYQEMLTVFADLRAQAARLHDMEAAMAAGDASDALLAKYGAAQEAFEMAGGYEYELRIQQVLTGLGFQDEQQHMPLEHCSGGQKTRALLARLLLEKPDLLILDEPTNHLDTTAVEWLEDTLHTWNGAVLVVSHDRYFLDRVVNTIWEMSRSGLESYRGNYSAYLQQREERWARREQEFETAREHFLKELDFVKRNIVRASTTDQAKGRLRRLVRLVKAVEVGGAQALNVSWSEFRADQEISGSKWNVATVEEHIKGLQNPTLHHHQLKMRLQTAQRGGNFVLRTYDLVIGYPQTPLFQAEDIELMRRECAALIGDNGTGKTTFLRTILGQLEPLAGHMRVGANLQLGYLPQVHLANNPDHTVLEELLDHQFMLLEEARSYLARFLFRGDEVFTPVSALSGGERSRLALALLALQKANFLLLDEPTNHLDIPAQEALQDALQHFEGTILMVSHDRYLIDKLATQIWDLRDGRLHVHKGNYRSYLDARQQAQERAKQQRTQETAQKRSAARPAPDPAQTAMFARAEALEQMEARIEELEQALEQLNRALAAAARDQRWGRVIELNRQHQDTQARLEALLAQWEELAEV
jgi:ATP-binding cassette subfamily F protein 3